MLQQLREFTLYKQSFNPVGSQDSSLIRTRSVIEHLGYVQIDTLAVVERAHHHILWNRVADYQASHLNTLLQQKDIFEYWFHAAAYLPMRDFRYALFKMERVAQGKNRYFQQADSQLMQQILARVDAEGEIRLSQLSQQHKRKTPTQQTTPSENSWWNNGPVRRAIEVLFMRGELMVSGREGMHKVYRLREHCIASDLDLSLPSMDEYALYLFQTMLRSHGVVSWKQLIHFQQMGSDLSKAMRQVIYDHMASGQIEMQTLENGLQLYVDVQALAQYQSQAIPQGSVKILSPFDNAVIHRDRLNGLFNFDYKLECYVNVAHRRYGYFCLPVLYGHQFVARMDCKAHRAQQRLEVISLHFEDAFKEQIFKDQLLKNHSAEGVQQKDQVLDDFKVHFQRELQAFAHFNQCPQVDADWEALLHQAG